MEYIINKTKVNSIKNYNTSLKMIFEEFIPKMITEFPNIFDSSISSLLEYRSIFKKYMVDNNRNFLLSFLKE